ncbi:putative reverse transcriptase domain-containing protein [Tanacetum coccineum]
MDSLNPLPPVSESKPDEEIEVENPIKLEDETVPASVYEIGKSSIVAIPRGDGDSLLPGFMRRDIESLFGLIVNLSRCMCGREMVYALVEKKGKAKDKVYGKLILDLGNEARSSVEQETAIMEKFFEKLGSVGEEAECKKLKMEHIPSIIPLKSAPMTQAAMCRMIKESVDATIIVEREIAIQRWFKKTESVFGISKCVEGKKVKFVAATLEGLALTWWNSKISTLSLETVNQMPWTEMKQLMTAKFCPRFNELALMCPRMVKPERVKVDAYIRGLTDNIKGEVTSSKTANLNEAIRMAHKLMEQKSQARNEIILEGKKRKWENLQSRSSSSKCHKCGKVRHKSRYCKEKSIATGANAQSIPTCYDCGEQGHTRNRCPKKVKQEEVGDVHGQAYAIKDVEPKGPNVVTVNHVFEIDLMPIELGTFDIIISMDWLFKHDAIIICGEKVVRIPYGNKTLIVEGDQDVLVIRDFPEVFPEELPGLLPSRKVESRIVLVPRATPLARAQYRLAPSEMKELSIQLQELLEKGFIVRVHHRGENQFSPVVFLDLMNRVSKPYLDKFVIVFIDDILIYSKDKEEHEKHLKIILKLLKKEKLYAKFSKCDFWLDLIQFLGHVIDRSGVYVDPTKVEAIKSWATPKTPTEVR